MTILNLQRITFSVFVLCAAICTAAARDGALPGEHGAARLMQSSQPSKKKVEPSPQPAATVPAFPSPPMRGADGEPRGVVPGPPPSDAIILFEGKDLSEWLGEKNRVPEWIVTNGVMIVRPHSGYLHTKRAFGDCQLHVEWATPEVVVGDSQGRGNSGIFLQGRYEIQVLDSFRNKTYYDGQAGSLYRQYPPLVNVSRPPGEWQTYDIIYHAPRFDADAKLTQPGTVTVLQNGVLVQDHVTIQGGTMSDHPTYTAHRLKEPLELQDHGNPVKYRNIWIREL